MSRKLQLAVGVVISGVCLWLSMRDVDPRAVWTALRGANYFGFVMVLATTLFGFWVRALRWRSLISLPKRISLDALFSATIIGFMSNHIMPLRLGEFVRPWALSRREGLSKTTLLATVVVERAVDMITLLGILGISLLVHPISSDTEAGRMTRAGAGFLVFMCVALTAFIVMLERQPRMARALIGWCARPLPERLRAQVVSMLEHFVEGLGLFRDLPRLLWVFVLSFGMFGVFILGLQASMWALGINLLCVRRAHDAGDHRDRHHGSGRPRLHRHP